MRISLATYDANVDLPTHFHEFPCMTFVLQGGFTEVTNAGEIEAAEHTVLVKPAAETHADRVSRWGVRSIHLEIRDPQHSSLAPFIDFLHAPSQAQSTVITSIARDVEREITRMDRISRLAIEGLCMQLIAESARCYEPAPRQTAPDWFRDTLRYIDQAVGNGVSLSSAAEFAGVHASHLSRVFRKQLGCSLGQYVRRLQLERAASSLRDSNASVGAIAVHCGFCDQSHFATEFKRWSGLTPRQYRKRHHRRQHGVQKGQQPTDERLESVIDAVRDSVPR